MRDSINNMTAVSVLGKVIDHICLASLSYRGMYLDPCLNVHRISG